MGLFQVVKRRLPDGTVARTKTWYARFKHPVTGRSVRVSLGTDDPKLAERRLHRAILEAESERHDPFREFAGVPLDGAASHLAEFERHLRRPKKRNTEAHIKHTIPRTRRVFDECGFVFWSDVTKERVEDFLDDLSTAEQSDRTINHYRKAVRQFTRWMRCYGRAATDPLESLEAVNVENEDLYRYLTEAEIAAIVEAARTGGPCEGVPGPERALLYHAAVGTGLRFNELRTLTWGCVRLDGESPELIVKARAFQAPSRGPAAVALRPCGRADRVEGTAPPYRSR